MKTCVVYDSQFGNTERIAQAIAEALSAAGPARAVRASQAQAAELGDVDLLIIGSPTVAWKPTPPVQAFLQGLSAASLGRLRIACFDTRMHLPFFMSRSAGEVMAKRLKALGAEPLLPPEGFWVKGREGPLQDGELERAAEWARTLRDRYESA